VKKENSSDYEKARMLAGLVAKDYAHDFFRLLVIYRDLSASEAAARLDLHIKTAQDFLDGLWEAEIVDKREAAEKKRPYFRYSLRKRKIRITLDLNNLYDPGTHSAKLNWKIGERKNSGALFKEGRDERITAVHFYEGEGRSRIEKRITLTIIQGRFLFHLPFPTEPLLKVTEICQKAGISEDGLPEVLDLVETLYSHRVIDTDK